MAHLPTLRHRKVTVGRSLDQDNGECMVHILGLNVVRGLANIGCVKKKIKSVKFRTELDYAAAEQSRYPQDNNGCGSTKRI